MSKFHLINLKWFWGFWNSRGRICQSNIQEAILARGLH